MSEQRKTKTGKNDSGCMTDEDWTQVEKRLRAFGYRVNLVCDEYSITLIRGRMSEMRDAIVVLKGHQLAYKDSDFDWVREETEARRRFACPHEHFMYTRKARESWKKLEPREQKQILRERGPGFDINEKVTTYSPLWQNFKRLKAHLLKYNKQIRLLDTKGI